MPEGDDSQIYRDLIRFKPAGLTPNAWATKAGVSRTVWSDMRRHGNPSRRTLERLLTAVGSTLAEFEALRIGGSPAGKSAKHEALADRGGLPWRAPQLPPLPLIATVLGGEWSDALRGIELTELRTGDVVDRIPRPLSLANDETAYALTILGNSMWPRFRPGRRVAVSPKASVAIGDDVLLKLKKSRRESSERWVEPALIKDLVRMSAKSVELRQFNPDVSFEVAADEILAIEKIVGELI